MKNYIAPVARFIDLHSEGDLMLNSGDVHDSVGGGNASNERSDFGSIWDTEE